MSSGREALELLYGHSPHSLCCSALLCIRIAFEELIEVVCHPLFKNKSLNIDSSLVPTNLLTVCKCKLLLNNCRFALLSIERSTQGMKVNEFDSHLHLGWPFQQGEWATNNISCITQREAGPIDWFEELLKERKRAFHDLWRLLFAAFDLNIISDLLNYFMQQIMNRYVCKFGTLELDFDCILLRFIPRTSMSIYISSKDMDMIFYSLCSMVLSCTPTQWLVGSHDNPSSLSLSSLPPSNIVASTVTQKTVPMFATFDFLPLYLHN